MPINPEERKFSGLGDSEKEFNASEMAETSRLDVMVDKFYDQLDFPIPAADKETSDAEWQLFLQTSANNLADQLEQQFQGKEVWAAEKLKAHVVFKEDGRRELFDKATEVLLKGQEKRLAA